MYGLQCRNTPWRRTWIYIVPQYILKRVETNDIDFMCFVSLPLKDASCLRQGLHQVLPRVNGQRRALVHSHFVFPCTLKSIMVLSALINGPPCCYHQRYVMPVSNKLQPRMEAASIVSATECRVRVGQSQ